MYDKYNRRINYLRVSVTDRCNLRCLYCMPPEGVRLFRHEDILSFEEITRIVTVAVSMGIDKVRITGGEPLVRKGIVNLVSQLASIEGIKDLSMTTNGILLEQFSDALFLAGIKRLNISLDTLDPDKYRKITLGGNLEDVIKGIFAAKKTGFHPIKLNCVVKGNREEKDALEITSFALENGFHLRFIPEMSLSDGKFSIVKGGTGGDCHTCNRLRLTANGMLKPCLFNDIEYNVRELGIENALKLAIENKPKEGTSNKKGQFINIGG